MLISYYVRLSHNPDQNYQVFTKAITTKFLPAMYTSTAQKFLLGLERTHLRTFLPFVGVDLTDG